jgi:hypothetical protein
MSVANVQQVSNAFPSPEDANYAALQVFVYSEAYGTRLVICDGKGHML